MKFTEDLLMELVFDELGIVDVKKRYEAVKNAIYHRQQMLDLVGAEELERMFKLPNYAAHLD